jgi:hypothetical protein
VKSSTTALVLGGVVLLGVGYAVMASAAPATPKAVRIEPHCQYRWVWVVRPPLNVAQLQGFVTAANNVPNVRNVEVSSSAQETRATLDVLSGATPAHDARPGVDSLNLGGLVMTLASVTRIDCE